MPKKKAGVAIGTWPTPERTIRVLRSPRFRFESFFLDQLRATGTIDRQADLNARYRLNIEAITFADSVGYFVDRVPEVCQSEFPPAWCLAAGIIIVDGRTLLIESLIANGKLTPESRLGWQKISRRAEFIEFAPSLFRQIKAKGWSAQKALDILDRLFAAVSGTAYPIPGSDLDRHCREHPEDPICWVAGIGFISGRARNLARELVLVSLLQREKLLSEEQTRAIYDVTYKELTPRRGLMDLPIPAGVIIVDGLELDPKDRAEIISSLGSSRVGLVDPDSPWAEKCLGEEPPPICRFINAFPIATTLTSELIKYKMWSKKDALEAWNKLQKSVSGEIIVDL